MCFLKNFLSVGTILVIKDKDQDRLLFDVLLAYVRDEVKITTHHSLVKELYSFLGLLAELFPDKCQGEKLKKLLIAALSRVMGKSTSYTPADFNIVRYVKFL